jgi:hypothetical protein
VKINCESAYSPRERSRAILSTSRLCKLRGIEQVPVLPAHGRRAILACYGPSLGDTANELMAEDGDIFTVSGAHDFLIERGATVRGHIESDPRPHKARFLQNPRSGVDYMLASVCDLRTWAAVADHKPSVWHVGSSKSEDDLIQRLWPDAFLTRGGTNVGISAIDLLRGLGYRDFSIHAMDGSFKAPEGILFFTGDLSPDDFRQIGFHAGAHPNEDQVPYRVWVGERPFFVSPQMMQSAQDFVRLRAALCGELKFEIHGDGFIKNLIDALDAGRELVTPGRVGAGRLTLRT